MLSTLLLLRWLKLSQVHILNRFTAWWLINPLILEKVLRAIPWYLLFYTHIWCCFWCFFSTKISGTSLFARQTELFVRGLPCKKSIETMDVLWYHLELIVILLVVNCSNTVIQIGRGVSTRRTTASRIFLARYVYAFFVVFRNLHVYM